MKRRERRAWVSQSGGVDAKCLQSMSGWSEKLADKSYAGTLHSTSLFLSIIEPISLSLSRFCPVFSPPPFHHPLVEPRRFSLFFPLLLLPLPLLLSARTIFIKPKGEKWLSSILVIAIGRGQWMKIELSGKDESERKIRVSTNRARILSWIRLDHNGYVIYRACNTSRWFDLISIAISLFFFLTKW